MSENVGTTPPHPGMSLEQAKEIVATKTAPRITEQALHDQIRATRYLRDGTLTICVIEMENGFKSVGKSAPVSSANFDAAVGERYAFEDAFKPLWALEAYRLLTDLSRKAQP